MKILRPIVRLTPNYAKFCVFETIAINGVGCSSLIFQEQLKNVCPYPGLYEYWFSPHIMFTNVEYLMCYMIAGWLGVAGILQWAINFDDNVPIRTKRIALYSFAACDLVWIVLMLYYTSYFSIYHIAGSAITIYQRTKFWMPSDMKEDPFLSDVVEVYEFKNEVN